MLYAIVEDPGGTWSVVEINTGKPVFDNGKPAVGLEKKYAYQLRFRIESEHLRRELTRKHTPF